MEMQNAMFHQSQIYERSFTFKSFLFAEGMSVGEDEKERVLYVGSIHLGL
jgi:hypothetical protein